MGLMEELRAKVSEKKPAIVFPEGEDARVLGACVRLKKDSVLEPIVLGNIEEIEKTAKDNNFDISQLNIVDPSKYDAVKLGILVNAFVERRKGKIFEDGARQALLDPNYFGTLLVYTDQAEGMVSGAAHTTGETVRPALQIIKTKPGVKKCSGVFIMIRGDEQYLMGDCAINIDVDAQDMADIAILADQTGKQFGMDPKIAMLSFSTKGSASAEQATKVAEATAIVKERAPEINVDGELQFDAAFVPSVGKSKAPNSPVAGCANAFIFPSLEAGNIGYKIAQRLGGFEAVGPILQGLNKPVNDLSRGCSEDDVYNLGIITAAQAIL